MTNSAVRLTDRDIDLICARANTLPERLAHAIPAASGGEALARRRLDRWKHLAGEDHARQLSSLQFHLGVEKITEDQLLARLGPISSLPDATRPAWSYLLQDIIEQVARSSIVKGEFGHLGRRGHGANRAIPYEPLYWPIAELALRRVLDACPEAATQLHTHALFGLMEHLVRRVSALVSPIVHPEFQAYLATAQSGMMQAFFGLEQEPASETERTRLYRKFVAERSEDGLRSFFLRFPVAARLVAETVLQWIEFTSEFLTRLRRDLARLEAKFNAAIPARELLFIKAGLSDPHDGGRSVLILGFEGGMQVVYKPRPMQVDLAFRGLVAAINSLAPEPGLRALEVIDAGDYGWMEFAAHDACHSQQEARRFYRRAGALACLVHWLHGIDFHYENVVASGEYPVLVDLEALAHPLRVGEPTTGDGTRPSWPLAGSALRTGLLPVWQPRLSGAGYYDASGLGAPVVQGGLHPGPVWRNMNTDTMECCQEIQSRRHGAHRPHLKGHRLPVRRSSAQVLAGFRQMSDLLQDTSFNHLLQWRQAIHNAPRRHIKKHTLVYRMLIQRSLKTSCLAEGVDRSIELCALPCESGGEEDWFQEVSSLERLDIPCFRTTATHDFDQRTPAFPEPLPWKTQKQLVKQSVLGKLEVREGRINERRSKT